MAVRFKAIKIDDPDLFGVQLSGSLNRGDKAHLERLADKCLANGKSAVIVDFAEVTTIGGSGAGILAEFQRRLLTSDGEAVFVGAGQVVRRYLMQSFGDLPLRCYDSIAAAQRDYRAGIAAVPGEGVDAPSATDTPTDTPENAPATMTDEFIEEVAAVACAVDEGSDRDLDTLLGEFRRNDEAREGGERTLDQDEAGERDQAEDEDAVDERPTDPDPADDDTVQTLAAKPAGGDSSTAGMRHYLSLEEAVATLDLSSDSESVGEALANLMHSYDLAQEIVYFSRQDDAFVTADGAFKLDGDSPLIAMLEAAEGPVTLLDLPDDEFSDAEMLLLEETRPDLILPIVWDQTLQAAAFLRSGKQDHEYGVSEHFALQLLMRVLTEQGAPDHADAEPSRLPSSQPVEDMDPGSSEDGADVPDDPSVLPALLELATGLPMTENLEDFWDEFTKRISKLFQVTTLGYFDLGTTPDPLVATGKATAGLHKIDLSDQRLRSYFCRLERPVRVANFPASFEEVREGLGKLGINWIFSCNADGRHLGVVVLGLQPWVELEDQTDVLARVLAVTADALGHVHQRQQAADLDLELVQTLILVQEQQRCGSARRTLLLTGLLRVLAHEVGFSKDQERDLLYGALLRDIGLAPQTKAHAADGKGLGKKELETYKRHPADGLDLLAPLEISDIIREVVLHHHELYNGKGFPEGLKGNKIPLAARLVAVVERYAELVTGVEGDDAREVEDAAKMLSKNTGKKYDPEIVDVFLRTVAPNGAPTR